MKYQQLENLESGWKWKYLVKKHREGELITCYIEASAAQEAVDILLTLENEPVQVNGWIEEHINPALLNRMKQTIRARRKRHFNAEHQHTRKKSIDLEFVVWQRLCTLLRIFLRKRRVGLAGDSIALGKLFAQLLVIALQPANLGVERSALVGHETAGPAIFVGTDRHFTVAGVEPQETVGHR